MTYVIIHGGILVWKKLFRCALLKRSLTIMTKFPCLPVNYLLLL